MSLPWRIFEISIKILAFFLALVVIAFTIMIVSLHFFDINEHRKIIEQQFKQISGMTLTLNGPIEATYFPVPTFHTKDASLIIPMKESQLIFDAKSFHFKISARSLFSTNLHLHDVQGSDLNVKLDNKQFPFQLRFEKVSGNIDTSPCNIRLSDLSLFFDGKEVNGNINFLNFAKKLGVEADLETPKWKVVPKGPINVLAILGQDKLSGKMRLKFGELQYDKYNLKDVHVDLKFNQDDVSANAVGQLPGAKFEANAEIESIQSHPKSHFNVMLEVQQLNELLKPFHEKIPIKSDGLKLTLNGECNAKDLTGLKSSCVTSFKGKMQSLAFHSEEMTKQNPNWSQFSLRDVDFDIHLQDPLTIEAKGKIPNGDFSSEFWIKDWQNDPTIMTEIYLNSHNSADTLKVLGPKWKLSGGNLNMHVQGRTQGKAFDEWLKRFKGHLFVHIKDMDVHEQKIDSRLVDVFALLSKSLSASHQDTTFECLAVRFQINDGVLLTQENFAVETPEIYALGTGTIDIPDHLMKLSFEVYPRSKSPLNVGAYNNAITIAGPLSQPKVSASGHGLVTKGGSIALGIATGGLSTLAEKFIDIIKVKGSPCAKVINEDQKADKHSLLKNFQKP